MIADVSTEAEHGRPEWVYRSTYHLLLDLGRFFVAAPRPPGIAKMPDRLCYENAAATACAHPSLRYAEGLATPGIASALPLEHAWCVAPDGSVVDPTWEAGAVYYGVALADSMMVPAGGGGLLSDFDRCLPLLRNGLPASALATFNR